MLELSDRLKNYIKKAGEETGREVLIEETRDLGLSGIQSGFVQHPARILVMVSPELQGEQLEQSIAHEITHGLLRYGRGFPQITPSRPLSGAETISISILCSMLEDIVVNKIIYEEGFPLFASGYLKTVQKEEKDLRDKSYFRSSAEVSDPEVKSRLMVSRYITAWGFLKYFHPDSSSRKILEKFLQSFERHYPQQYQMATRIRDIIIQNDIFTPGGYNQIIRRCLELWRLYDLVELRVAE